MIKYKGHLIEPNRGDVGFDLVATKVVSFATNYGHFRISTGVSEVEFPANHYGKIEGRSSLAELGVSVLGGVIDPSYKGEIIVILFCPHNKWFPSIGDKVAQLVVMPYTTTTNKVQQEVERGSKGFGSTGK